MQDDLRKGLYQKYRVERVDGKPIKDGCVTLEFGDPNAWPALQVWADTVRAAGYEALADDVEARLVPQVEAHVAATQGQPLGADQLHAGRVDVSALTVGHRFDDGED